MQNKRRKEQSMFSLAGWPFADLLLAITTIFIVASAVGVYVPPLLPMSTVAPTPTVSRVNTDSYQLCFQINDYSDLLNDLPDARNEVAQQIQHDSFLNSPSRRAALGNSLWWSTQTLSQEATGLSIAIRL